MGLFILLRRIERWLHQHIFKVGWLITRNFQTTTILYYTFFLPGIFLHELTYWLAAGMLNVRATVDVPIFKKEEDGKQNKSDPDAPPQKTIKLDELKADFVTLDFGRGRRRKALWRNSVIAVIPLLVALVCIWFVADNIFNILDVVATMQTGKLPDIANGFGILTGSANFWLWIYVVFTLANTMFPPVPPELKGWKTMALTGFAVGLTLTVIGIGGEIFEALQTPLSSLVNVMLVTLVLLISIDVLMVLVLGLIEYTIEHVTGHTATFRGETMEVMTREEALEYYEREQEKQRRAQEREARRRNKAADTGPSSVYVLTFSVPGAPGEIPVTPLEVEEEVAAVEETQLPIPEFAPEPETSEDFAARINIPRRRTLSSEPDVPVDDATEADEAGEEKSISQPAASIRDRIAPPPPSSTLPDKPVDEVEDVEPAATVERKPISLVPEESKPIEEGEAEEIAATVVRKPIALVPSETVSKPEEDEADGVSDERPEEEQPAATLRPSESSAPTVVESDTADDTDGDTDDEGEALLVEPVQERVVGRPAPLEARFRPRFVEDDEDNESDEDSDDEADDIVDTPAASHAPSSRFGTRRFGTGRSETEQADDEADDTSDEDEVEATEPAASIRSRFSTSRFRRVSDTDTSNDAQSDETDSSTELEPAKPKGILSTPQSESDTEDDESTSQPAASVRSRFGISPFRSKDAADDETRDESEEKSTQISLEPARPKGILSSRLSQLADEADDGDEEESKSVAALRSRFGRSAFSRPSIAEDEDDETSDAQGESTGFDMSPARPKGLLRTSSDDEDEDEEAARPIFSRGTSRLGTSPFSSRSQAEEDEDEEDEEESLMRRGRGTDAVSDLFGSLNLNTSQDDDEDDEDLDDIDDRFSRFRSRPSSTSSRFGSRPSILGRSNITDDDIEYADDDDYEYMDDDDDEYLYDDDNDDEYYDFDDD